MTAAAILEMESRSMTRNWNRRGELARSKSDPIRARSRSENSRVDNGEEDVERRREERIDEEGDRRERAEKESPPFSSTASLEPRDNKAIQTRGRRSDTAEVDWNSKRHASDSAGMRSAATRDEGEGE